MVGEDSSCTVMESSELIRDYCTKRA